MNKIGWCDKTIGPFVGCTRVSAGCDHCYAASFAHRGLTSVHRGLTKATSNGPAFNGTVRFVPEALDKIRKLATARTAMRVFIGSMCDLGHENAREDDVRDVFDAMYFANDRRFASKKPPHTFLILTKRPAELGARWRRWNCGTPLVDWGFLFGVSVEDHATADARIPEALKWWDRIFVSAEPLLGPVDLSRWLPSDETCEASDVHNCDLDFNSPRKHVSHISWVIAGGESGPRARPAHPDWARRVRDDCEAARVPFFFKQWGEWVPVNSPRMIGPALRRIDCYDGVVLERQGKAYSGRLLDGREHNATPEGR